MSPKEKDEVVDLVASMLTSTGHATHVRRSRRAGPGSLVVTLRPTEVAPDRLISIGAVPSTNEFAVSMEVDGAMRDDTLLVVPTSGILGALAAAIGSARQTTGPYRNRRKTSRRR